MKIIFYSEEQKLKFIDVLGPLNVLEDVVEPNLDICKFGDDTTCRKCWENSGIEIEVKEND